MSALLVAGPPMHNLTHILAAVEQGDPRAAEQLLPLVYEELRRLAAARMSQESPDHTLQATALVHEAYVRLVDVNQAQHWNSRGHFFGAAAEAMRRILIEAARRKRSQPDCLGEADASLSQLFPAEMGFSTDDLLDLDEAVSRLATLDPAAAELVKLRVYTGLSVEEAASVLNVPERSAYRDWAFAKAWLFRELRGGES